jgi:ABC-type transporter Mla MlaB component
MPSGGTPERSSVWTGRDRPIHREVVAEAVPAYRRGNEPGADVKQPLRRLQREVSMTATFRISDVPPDAWLRIEGELDVVSRAPLAWRLIDLDQSSCTRLYLDVGDVTHVDSTSMRLIDDARKRFVARGGTFEVTAASLIFTMVAGMRGYRALAAPTGRDPRRPGAAPRLTPVSGQTSVLPHHRRDDARRATDTRQT